MQLSKAKRQAILGTWVAKKWAEQLEQARIDAHAALANVFTKQHAEEIAVLKNTKHKDILKYVPQSERANVQYTIVESFSAYSEHTFSHINTPRYAKRDLYSSACLTMCGYEDELQETSQKYNAVVGKFHEEKTAVNALLCSVTTVKKLVDLMPEIEKYIPFETDGRVTALVSAGTLAKAKAVL